MFSRLALNSCDIFKYKALSPRLSSMIILQETLPPVTQLRIEFREPIACQSITDRVQKAWHHYFTGIYSLLSAVAEKIQIHKKADNRQIFQNCCHRLYFLMKKARHTTDTSNISQLGRQAQPFTILTLNTPSMLSSAFTISAVGAASTSSMV